MQQRLIKNLEKLPTGIYLFEGRLVYGSKPEPSLVMNYDQSPPRDFIKRHKSRLKSVVKEAGFSDVFVAYWFFDTKARAFIYSENEDVNRYFLCMGIECIVSWNTENFKRRS